MDTRKLLEELENVIDSATEVPFSNKKMVDKDEIERLIDAINQSLPNELESARRIVADKERILLDAEKKADDTIAQAKDYIARITEESELVKQAQERANEVVTAANHSAEELRSSSVTYATDVLKYVETNMENMLDTLKKNRQSLIDSNKLGSCQGRTEIKDFSFLEYVYLYYSWCKKETESDDGKYEQKAGASLRPCLYHTGSCRIFCVE